MALMDAIKAKAKSDIKHIVLAEGTEPRTVEAAGIIAKEGLAKVTLLGDIDEIKKVAGDKDLTGVNLIDPEKAANFDEYVEAFYEMRKAKGVTPEAARETMKNTLYYATMMIKKGEADGMVAGAINSTGNTIRPALQIIKTKPGVRTVSGSFLMEVPGS
ncbi:MAG: phosphate acetyltransferase, partial [Christensenellaceae bacterium]|nr:phosphate acetyltransferase [Christensenellaceae bacterium]